MKVIPPKEVCCVYKKMRVGSVFSVAPHLPGDTVHYYLKTRNNSVNSAVNVETGEEIPTSDELLCIVHKNPVLYIDGVDEGDK